MLVFVAVGLGACAYPQTQMEPVSQPALQTATPPANGSATEKEKEKKTSAAPVPSADG
jgi:hypothetical protein